MIKQWKSLKTIHEHMDLIVQAQIDIQRAKTALGNRPEQASQLIDFLNRQDKDELAAVGITNRTEAILMAKKVLTLRSYVQTA